MKRMFFIIAISVAVLVSCEKNPDMSQKDGDYFVLTEYDRNTDFSKFTKYYLPDSVLFVSGRPESVYLTDYKAMVLLDVCRSTMNARGYVESDTKQDADLGIQLTYIENTDYFTGYVDSPYWWYGYPGYWTPGYWGYWDYWYYPFQVSYSYKSYSMMTEIIDLTDNGTDEKKPLKIVWNSYIVNPTGAEMKQDKLVKAIEQSFIQSGYIKK